MSNINKVKRTSTKGALTRFINHFNSVKELENIDIDDLQRRLDRANTLLTEFNDSQNAIEAEDSDFETNYSNYYTERDNFERDYFAITSAVHKFILSKKIEYDTTSNISFNNSNSRGNSNMTNISLPQLKLPTFDGTINQWLFYRDSFKSIIHDNNTMSNVQKFHYLRLSLEGSAADRINSLQICDDNYEVAWKLLNERFEDKQALIKNHVKALFELPTLKEESYQGLNSILDGIEKNINALEVLKRPTDQWDDLMIHLVTTKFDSTTKREWESRSDSRNIPTLKSLLDFLKERCRILSSLEFENNSSRQRVSKQPFQRHSNSKSFATTSNKIVCIFCKNNHNLYTCPEFNKMTVIDRLNTAKRLRLCINCLGSNHRTKDCKSAGCRRCGKIHHSMLHFQNNIGNANNAVSENSTGVFTSPGTSNNKDASTSTNSATAVETFNSQHTFTTSTIISSQILLSTALVTVFDQFNNAHKCRVLLDSGSQVNFISERLAEILHLSRKSIDVSVSGINEMHNKVHHSVLLKFKSNVNNYEKTISCIVLPQITGYLPSSPVNSVKLNIPVKLELADPNFDKPAPIDMLIGADTFWDLLSIGQVKLGYGLPILQKTKLGWLVSGPSQTKSETFTSHHCSISTNKLESQVAKFWEIEEFPKIQHLSEEEIYCEQHFKDTICQNTDGRFIATIPFKQNTSVLGQSRTIATKRFLNLERKLEKNPDLKSQYHSFIREYIQLGHMSLANNQNDDSGFFLPHHCVLKQDSSTTKLRVVFDGSAKTSSDISLNDIMMVGPKIQDNLFYILLRFRKHNYVLSADVVKMYRQVLIADEQRNFQKILWRFDSESEVMVYVLNTITYGLASSAFLAIRSLQEIAHRHRNEYPHIADVILHDFYVDDLLTGAETVDELRQLKESITELLYSYGFPLRKWSSNDRSFLLDSNTSTLCIGDEAQGKTLGLLWNPVDDCLLYSINTFFPNSKITKRLILSSTAQIFDPLGLLSPVTIRAKIILQELWKIKLSWDESLPSDLHTAWTNYHSQLQHLNTVRIPRQSFCPNAVSTELHGFCDASQAAYGACVYIRCRDMLGNYTCNLYCAKTRVAPLKLLTIPRLELSGALLLAELVDKVVSTGSHFECISYWCDSMICISWIHSSPHLLKTFVANRVAQIQAISNPKAWNYVNTQDNPADLLSRGLAPLELINSNLWFHGPSWLIRHHSYWPSHETNRSILTVSELPEVRNNPVALINTSGNFLCHILTFIESRSSILKLQRIFAYFFRFIHNLKQGDRPKRQGSLSTNELNESLYFLIHIVQRQHFSDDYRQLSHSKPLNKRSKLLSLNPFYDETNKVIRVGGRLEHSQFDFQKKHPIVLPSNSHITVIIVRDEHLRLLHAGPQALLASIRDKFWPLSGRNLVKKIIHDCVRCFRCKARAQEYIMSNLPSTRVSQFRPFSVSGVDYAGPFQLRDRKGRYFKISKTYIALFVCFATKALHLEAVSDLTSECFLACLRRFMSRRGKCTEIHSDNGTTFVGANNDMKIFFDSHKNEITDNLANEGVQWKFITPNAPHFGGIWEAGVKSTKYHLKRVIGNAILTFEEFATVLCQIEACLNSRPLCPISTDPSDDNPLTPAHFLIGTSLTALPEPNLINLTENRITRYQRLQQIIQHFWSRWSKEYISQLQVRVKWKTQHPQLMKIGTLVLIKEDGLPPLKWKLGRIIQMHQSPDKVIRSVTIRTSTGELKRPVVKICVLPIS